MVKNWINAAEFIPGPEKIDNPRTGSEIFSSIVSVKIAGNDEVLKAICNTKTGQWFDYRNLGPIDEVLEWQPKLYSTNKIKPLQIKTQLQDNLEKLGYFALREIPGRGLCGLHGFMFTIGIVTGLDASGYKGRFCYPIEYSADAVDAIINWDGSGDPAGQWIKYKGEGGERRNEQFKNELKYY